MSDIKKRDYRDYPEEFLPTQFQYAENTYKLLEIFLKEDQLFQDELEKLFTTGLDLDTAGGYQLEIIGKLSGVDRVLGQSDEDYRNAIKFKRVVDNGSGTHPEIVQFVKSVSGQEDVVLFNHYPQSFATQIKGGETLPVGLADKIASVAAAGINAHTVIHFPEGKGMVLKENSSTITEFNSMLAENDGSAPEGVGVLAEAYTSKNYI